jgi:hypothetical protein
MDYIARTTHTSFVRQLPPDPASIETMTTCSGLSPQGSTHRTICAAATGERRGVSPPVLWRYRRVHASSLALDLSAPGPAGWFQRMKSSPTPERGVGAGGWHHRHRQIGGGLGGGTWRSASYWKIGVYVHGSCSPRQIGGGLGGPQPVGKRVLASRTPAPPPVHRGVGGWHDSHRQVHHAPPRTQHHDLLGESPHRLTCAGISGSSWLCSENHRGGRNDPPSPRRG